MVLVALVFVLGAVLVVLAAVRNRRG